MKNLKLIIYLFVFSMTFIACENDNFGPIESTVTETEEVVIGFLDDNNGASLLEDGGEVVFEVFLSKALSYDGNVELEVTSSDGSIESSGVQEVTYQENFIIPAGVTSVPVTFTFSDDTLNDGEETYTVRIKNFTTATTLTQQYVISASDVNKKERIVKVYDVLPTVVETTVGDVQVEFTWRNSSADLDLYLIRGTELLNANVIDYSVGTTTTEIVELPTLEVDNIFTVYAQYWTSPVAVDYTMTFTFPDAQEIEYTGTISDDSILFQFNKETNGDDVTYIISQL
ncbi:hypothetical protein C7447_101149 [Tenacibaculum adriaticum]|uniref:Calx-beta domain-containing protein n=1 Tax=Tenacibaculum adriaticum TaxID=413713 RepID=A0A5S5DY76_9FLAO|nr:hypothetical protein [Tenacibaculum adriaticum]TYP99549.1 hypothetical protein C7447_101149 [Tenacibaculum adriaticum]